MRGTDPKGRPLAPPQALSQLIGDHACRRQADDTAAGAAPGRPVARRCHGRRDGKPQLGVIRGAGKRRHRGVTQRTACVRDRLEHLSVEGAEALGDLPQPPRRRARPPYVHRFNLCRLYIEDHPNFLYSPHSQRPNPLTDVVMVVG
jgi:hypothetical protein